MLSNSSLPSSKVGDNSPKLISGTDSILSSAKVNNELVKKKMKYKEKGKKKKKKKAKKTRPFSSYGVSER